MYIAIVADNIADRKQAERLLSRANTALAPELGTLYISAFGDEKSFLHACMKFDLFILDFDHDTRHSLNIAETLRTMNAPGVSAICKPEDEPFSYETAIKGIYTLDKPILTAPLHKLIKDAWQEAEEKRKQVTLIELRTENGTFYIPKDDIIYVAIDEADHLLTYHISGRTPVEVRGSLSDLDKALSSYPEFTLKMKNLCVNADHIQSEDKKSILLSNGERFEFGLFHKLFSH